LEFDRIILSFEDTIDLLWRLPNPARTNVGAAILIPRASELSKATFESHMPKTFLNLSFSRPSRNQQNSRTRWLF